MTKRFLRMTIAYDGNDFAGWQRQPGKRTVQGEFEDALYRILGRPTLATASGRTDAGVHALAQVVGIETEKPIAEPALQKALNAELPEDIHVFDVSPAPIGFDPIRDAVRKRYRYLICDGRTPDIFARRYVWHLFHTLDEAAMRESAQALVGKHDFAAYQTKGSSRLTTVRTLFDVTVERIAADRIDKLAIEVEADGFLYNMVRNIVGTLVEVGRGKRSITWPAQVLASRDRKEAGMVAPAHGLYLLWVRYD
jgi:tRNA pseudouridine38-40 synthase